MRRGETSKSVIALRLTKTEAARVYGVLAKIVAQWVGRYRKEGRKGIITYGNLRQLHRLIFVKTVEMILGLRRKRLSGRQIAW